MKNVDYFCYRWRFIRLRVKNPKDIQFKKSSRWRKWHQFFLKKWLNQLINCQNSCRFYQSMNLLLISAQSECVCRRTDCLWEASSGHYQESGVVPSADCRGQHRCESGRSAGVDPSAGSRFLQTAPISSLWQRQVDTKRDVLFIF